MQKKEQKQNDLQQPDLQKAGVKCSACRYWSRLDNLWTKVKNSKFGECSQPKLFGWDFMQEMNKVDRKLKTGDEVLIVQEYFATPAELKNEKMIVGESFGCVHFKHCT